jgi:thiamine-triphosphatase
MADTYEVERNFALSEEEHERLLSGATFLQEQTFTDIYYDTPTYTLTLQDKWLRSRNVQWELKLPIEMTPGSLMDQYQEIAVEKEIRSALGFPPEGKMQDILTQGGYAPFCTCMTTRQMYIKEGFTIVTDLVEYEGCEWIYETCEIELLVRTREEIPEAGARINEFATTNGLSSTPSHGKVIEYLLRERPEHFKALADAGVLTRTTGA